MDGRLTAEDRQLIQALMLQGWYRDGRSGPDQAGKSVWRFRSGHSREALQRAVIGVRARSERAAMREVLRCLDREREPSLGAASPAA